MKCVIENGKAVIEQTNLEYYQNCSPEEFAKFINNIYLHNGPMPLVDGLREGYEKACSAYAICNAFNWLKQPHKENE